LPKTEIQNLLVVGVDTVSIADSARRAGYEIYAVDYFGDVDLRRVCSKYESVIYQEPGKSCGKFESRFKPEAFLKMARLLLKKVQIDAALLASGLDDHFDVLRELNELVPILGNHLEVIKKVRDKSKFFGELKRLGIRHPETESVREIKEAKMAAAEIGYPVVIKPSKGFGGSNIRKVRNPEELEKAFERVFLGQDEVLIQKLIEGVHASASLVASEVAVRTLTINRQLTGLSYVFQREPFGYCGNVVPLRLSNAVFEECKCIAEKVALHFSLKGSNGVDLVVCKGKTPYVVEVNPRFQGTTECVEHVLGVNLVRTHVNACIHNSIPTIEKPSKYCTRLILYTPTRVITPDLTSHMEVRDVPLPGTVIEKCEPLCSIIVAGNNQQSSLGRAKKLAKKIYTMLRPA